MQGVPLRLTASKPKAYDFEPTSLGEVLWDARKSAGLSQPALAEKVGIAPGQVSRLESGIIKSPEFLTVARVAAVLNLPLDQLAAECLGRDTSRTDAANALAMRHEVAALVTMLEKASDDAASMNETVKNALQRAKAALASKPTGPKRKNR